MHNTQAILGGGESRKVLFQFALGSRPINNIKYEYCYKTKQNTSSKNKQILSKNQRCSL